MIMNIDWREKYLEFLKINKIVLSPLYHDAYDWEIEFKRVQQYKHWDLFKNVELSKCVSRLFRFRLYKLYFLNKLNIFSQRSIFVIRV